MPILNRLLRAALGAALVLPTIAFADEQIRPLPVPDLSKLDAAQREQLSAGRAEFDKIRPTLIGPPLAQAYAEIGAGYARAGLKDVAAVAFYDAAQVDPGDSRWWYLRGVLARDLKQNAEARADFEAALAIDKVYLPIIYRLSDTLIDLGDADAARKLLEQAARDHPDQATTFAMLGQLGMRQKRYTDAVENLLAALKIDPDASQLYQPLSEAYTAIGNTKAAAAAQAKIGKGTPRLSDPLALGLYADRSAAQPSGSPLQQAQQLINAGEFAAARTKLTEALSAQPENVEALVLQARLEASLGEAAIAQTAADKALRLAPDNGAALLARGMVHEYAGHDDQAYALYQRAVRADGKLATARLLLGNAEMRRGQYAPASEEYRQLVTLQPANIQAQMRLTAAYVAAGQCGRALAEVSAAQLRNAKDGDLMQLFVRLASTCPAAKTEERDMALDYAQALYEQRADSGDSSALALALAAHGKFKEAQQYQAEAIFGAVRAGDKTAADQYRSTQASFVASKVPERPWPAEHSLFKPLLLTPVRLPAAAKQ